MDVDTGDELEGEPAIVHTCKVYPQHIQLFLASHLPQHILPPVA